jgi:hypothetical protein
VRSPDGPHRRLSACRSAEAVLGEARPRGEASCPRSVRLD